MGNYVTSEILRFGKIHHCLFYCILLWITQYITVYFITVHISKPEYYDSEKYITVYFTTILNLLHR